jgi:hypothetical protein
MRTEGWFLDLKWQTLCPPSFSHCSLLIYCYVCPNFAFPYQILIQCYIVFKIRVVISIITHYYLAFSKQKENIWSCDERMDHLVIAISRDPSHNQLPNTTAYSSKILLKGLRCFLFFFFFFPFFIRYLTHLHFQCYTKSPPYPPTPTPLPTHSPFLALVFPCTGAYKVCKSNGPLFPVMAD